MNPKQAEKLGALLRKQREARELSVRDLATRAGVSFSTIARIEQGLFDRPRPEKLAAVADALGLSQSEIMRLAGYRGLTNLPAPATYLRTKYRNMPSDQLARVTQEVEAVLKRHGVQMEEGPARGEDESLRLRRESNPRKKGGKR